MLIAQVVGTVVATRKHERLVGSKIQILQPLDPKTGGPNGDLFVAIDVVGAGAGERVVVVGGSGARYALENEQTPVDATIIGIIDHIDIEGQVI